MCPTLVLLRPLATPALALAVFDSLVHRRCRCPGLGYLSRIFAPQLPQLTVRSFKSRCPFKLVSSPHCPVHHHC
ncbi:hypothetical protein LXA43DRAFT_1025295 [Ganoderma leucocontextum]|nr:hypothetical protein LXA43DRAFT_1025295 [Ganoderma leucocontextum]